ncbi:MAG: SDR family oxidoreductase [Jatrophihabitans sp.]|nr:MAG: SDR family oxidoreductase [Jatrophihabitans sp.]
MTGEHRVAIVTGGARGIGQAVAHRLRADGFVVASFDLGEHALPASQWSAAAAGTASLRVDVADEQAVTAGVEWVAETLGAPTVLINNAGVTRDNLLFKMSAGQWDDVIGVHLRGAFLMSRAVQKFMVDAKWGRIVNMSSTSALGNRGQVNYSAAKAGLQGLTKTLAIELGKFGVTVNAIAPGFIETEMVIATAERMGIPYEEFKAASAARIPVARVGVPDDVAATVSFFVRDEASYVSGQVLYLAGGPRV